MPSACHRRHERLAILSFGTSDRPEEADILDYLSRRDLRSDGLSELLRNAPVADQPVTSEEEEGVAEARAEIARGEVISTEEIRREFA